MKRGMPFNRISPMPVRASVSTKFETLKESTSSWNQTTSLRSVASRFVSRQLTMPGKGQRRRSSRDDLYRSDATPRRFDKCRSHDDGSRKLAFEDNAVAAVAAQAPTRQLPSLSKAAIRALQFNVPPIAWDADCNIHDQCVMEPRGDLKAADAMSGATRASAHH